MSVDHASGLVLMGAGLAFAGLLAFAWVTVRGIFRWLGL